MGYKLKRILMWVNQARLPSEYQEVEYIESVGGQYINTGYLPSSAPKIEIDFMQLGNTTSDNWYAIYGRRGSSTSTYFCIYVNKTSPYYMTPNYAGLDPGASSGITAPIGAKVNVVNDKGQFYVDGNYISASSTTNTLASATYPIYLFGNNINGTNQNRGTKMRLYHCKMWNDGTLVRDFIPCYRKSDSVIGLYDLVNNQFYTNSGSGTFTKGTDVPDMVEKEVRPSEYQEVEYIQSSGTQYIDTGKIVDGNTSATYTYMPKEYVDSRTNGGGLVGMDNGWKVNGFGSGNVYVYFGNQTSSGAGVTLGTLTQDTMYTDVCSKSGCSRNGGTVWTPPSTTTAPSGTLKLFVFQRSGSITQYFKTRFYSFKRYDSGVLTQDLVPCYRKSDSVIGLYDRVNGTFYTNAGSGTFTKGPDL